VRLVHQWNTAQAATREAMPPVCARWEQEGLRPGPAEMKSLTSLSNQGDRDRGHRHVAPTQLSARVAEQEAGAAGWDVAEL
jgi:hypothetical protein